jgi:hypothetical protein
MKRKSEQLFVMEKQTNDCNKHNNSSLDKLIHNSCNNHKIITKHYHFGIICKCENTEQCIREWRHKNIYNMYECVKHLIENDETLLKDSKRCVTLINIIIDKYVELFSKEVTEDIYMTHTLDDITDVSTHKLSTQHKMHPPPHVFVELFFKNGFTYIDKLNIYQIVSCADPTLFRMILERGYDITLHPDLLDHLIERNNEYYCVVEPYKKVDTYSISYDLDTNLIFHNMFIKICTMILEEGKSKQYTFKYSKKIKNNNGLAELINNL